MDAVDKILEQWRAERPDLEVRAMGPIGRLSRVARHFSNRMGDTFARYGLNAAGFDVLATLRRSGRPYTLSAGELMVSMMITSGTMTNRIDQLCKAGLVRRKTDPGDGRRAVMTFTPKGYDLIEKAMAEHVETQNELLASLSDAEIKQLDRLLGKLMEALERD